MHASAGRANPPRPSERGFLGFFRFVLRYRDQRGHAFAFGVKTANHVARALRSDHDDVDIFVGDDQLEMYGQAVAEQESFALREIGQNILFVHVGLLHVGQTDHDDICPFDCLSMAGDPGMPWVQVAELTGAKTCVSCYLCESACDKGAIVLRPPANVAPAAAARFNRS